MSSSHKAGELKQSNKSHKTKFRTKGTISGEAQGRMPSIKVTASSKKDHRQDRRNKANQHRKDRRIQTTIERIKASAPFFLVIVDLCSPDNSQGLALFHQLIASNNPHIQTASSASHSTVFISRLKKHITMSVAPRDVFSVMELAKVADMLLFVLTAGAELDEIGQTVVAGISMQGVPTVSHVIVGLEALNGKKRIEVKKACTRLAHSSFPQTKVHSIEKAADIDALPWALVNQKQHVVRWKKTRAQVFADHVAFVPNEDGQTGTLQVTGYVRCRPWNVNRLVHLPGFGSFQLSSIQSAIDPCASKREADDISRIVATPDGEQQESLQSEVPIDPLAAEQTWPTEEELQNADLEERIRRSKAQQKSSEKFVRAPKGTSSYQAAWIEDEEEGDNGENADGDDDEDDESNGDEMQEDHEHDENEDIWERLQNSHMDDDKPQNGMLGQEDDEELDLVPRKEDVAIDRAKQYDDAMAQEESIEVVEKRRAADEDMRFPDEVDTPIDIPANVRFQKYRGLASFRSSPWDPKEELPLDYARIFQFENFSRTCKRVLEQDADDDKTPLVQVGQYVTLNIAQVPVGFMERPSAPLVIFSLLPHENKMSVMHFRITMHPSYQTPIKSKERLIFSTGLRTFKAGAIFSQHAMGEKHKFERYFQPGSTVVASVFAPITFPPAPVLVFREVAAGQLQLVASGALYSVNPDRMVIKRIRLSGYPFKISKRMAVVRYMFFTPEDIAWFKPVELVTKHGARGHIKESLGTHGHMKCLFDNPIKAHDVVLMNLYKRVYPKWTFDQADLSGCNLAHLHLNQQAHEDDNQMATDD